MNDLEKLCKECHTKNISVCLDFVMNHTSEDHEWAIKAKQGDEEYQNRYYFYDSYDIPAQYEATVPQVFPTTAPGNFTWNPETGKHVMTTFYPYQWDLNYGNPIVLNEMISNMLFLVNKGVDIIRIDAVPYIWKQLGTNCRNLPQVHNIVRIMRIVCEIVCPGVLLLGEVVMEPDKIAPYFGTTASLCGIEKASYEQNQYALDEAIRYDIALHAYMLVQSGIPVIYSGDEIGQQNDYSYHENPSKCEDSRYLHRGKFQWELARNRNNPESVQGKLFHAIKKLGEIRKAHTVFSTDADVYTIYTGDNSVLGVVRENQKEKLIALYNFSEDTKEVWIEEIEENDTELLLGKKADSKRICFMPFEAMWFIRTK